MYAQGGGVPKDDAESVKWYRLAADQGHAQARNNFGWMYENGKGVPRDYGEAVKWYREAAAQGSEYANRRIAELQYRLAETKREARAAQAGSGGGLSRIL